MTSDFSVDSDATWFDQETATLGDRLAAAREAAGLSQDELAERLGVRRKTIRTWENDMAEPRANRIQMLAGMLGVSLRWLLTGEGDGVASPDMRAGHPDAATLLPEIRQMRVQMGEMAEQLGRLEVRLRLALAREAA